MSPVRVSIVASFLLFGACAHAQEPQAGASASTQQRGDVREVPDFDEVSVSHGIRAEVKVGPKSVRLEGPAELVSRIELDVHDGTLRTRVDKKLFSGFKGGSVRLYVSSPRVEGIHASGGSHVDADATRTDEFDVDASGGAIVNVRGVDARQVDAEASGGSKVTLAAANPRAMQIQLLLLLGDTTMVERVVGLQLVRGGAQEMGDEAGREQALARIDALEGAVALFRKASIDRWPLHALTEELIQASTRDEPAYLLSFTRVEAKQAAETQQP
ncbi:DUF2807 domain-containing protein [Myxococcus sp. CA006]|uniref:GIN domain-containing protein n=1 Tax=Myxococcus sp. CA006 TaxID=2562799 RepID=UPI001E4363FA|nr:DUF2807 domain-containing protein [Myxococcus sp. CA006]